MPKFNYTAKKSDGTELSGSKEAPDRFALARELRTQDLTVINVEMEKEKGGGFNLNSIFSRLFRVPMKDKIMFAGSLSAMIGAGLSLGRALQILARQTTNRRFKEIIDDLGERIKSGGTLSAALGVYPDVFPPVFIAMVGAGEESGNLPESLEIVRQQLAKSYDLRRKVRGAMIYPIIIVFVIIAIAILMMIYLVPTLTTMFLELEVDLPLSTRMVIFTSDLLSNHILLFLLSVVIVLIVGFKLGRTDRGRRSLAWAILRLPIIKVITRNLNAAVTMRTISSLVTAGVSMMEALTITERVIQNPYFKAVLAQAGTAVQTGRPLSQVFAENEGLYPILVGEMAEVGEETGDLSGMLLKGAIFFEEEVDQATKNLSTIIEPALMVLIGLAVGFFAVSMLGPIYSLMSVM